MNIMEFAVSAKGVLTSPLLPSLTLFFPLSLLSFFSPPLLSLLSSPFLFLPLSPLLPLTPPLSPLPFPLPPLPFSLPFPLLPFPLYSPSFQSLFFVCLSPPSPLSLLIAPNLLTTAGCSSTASWRRKSPRRQSGGGTSLSASSHSRRPSQCRRTPAVVRPLRYWRRNRSTRCRLSARQGGDSQ